MTGGFTGTGAMGVVERPMGFAPKTKVLTPKMGAFTPKKKKVHNAGVREDAQRVVECLLAEDL